MRWFVQPAPNFAGGSSVPLKLCTLFRRRAFWCVESVFDSDIFNLVSPACRWSGKLSTPGRPVPELWTMAQYHRYEFGLALPV